MLGKPSLPFIVYLQELPSELVAMDTDPSPHGEFPEDGELSTEQVGARELPLRIERHWLTYESSCCTPLSIDPLYVTYVLCSLS